MNGILLFIGSIELICVIVWLWRLAESEDSDEKTSDGEYLVKAGYAYYTEDAVAITIIVSLVIGIGLVIVGLIW
jgi:hypothetical protein